MYGIIEIKNFETGKGIPGTIVITDMMQYCDTTNELITEYTYESTHNFADENVVKFDSLESAKNLIRKFEKTNYFLSQNEISRPDYYVVDYDNIKLMAEMTPDELKKINFYKYI